MIANRVIGGNGGETASIFVTGLSETDTVTATKDGRTYGGKWVSREIIFPNQPLIPTMTSNTTPEGICFVGNRAKGSSSAVFTEPYLAFDGDDTSEFNNNYNTNTNIFFGYKFAAPTKITSVGWRQVNSQAYPTTFKVQYSDDNSTWYDVESFNFDDSSSKKKVFQTWGFSVETTAHLYWRMQATSWASGSGGNYNWAVTSAQFYGEKESAVNGWLFDKLSQYGTYTITATDGTNTATQDVLVDMATQYDIQMTIKEMM